MNRLIAHPQPICAVELHALAHQQRSLPFDGRAAAPIAVEATDPPIRRHDPMSWYDLVVIAARVGRERVLPHALADRTRARLRHHFGDTAVGRNASGRDRAHEREYLLLEGRQRGHAGRGQRPLSSPRARVRVRVRVRVGRRPRRGRARLCRSPAICQKAISGTFYGAFAGLWLRFHAAVRHKTM